MAALTLVASATVPAAWADVSARPVGQTVPPINLEQGSPINVGGGTIVRLSGNSVTVKVTPQTPASTIRIMVGGVEYTITIMILGLGDSAN